MAGNHWASPPVWRTTGDIHLVLEERVGLRSQVGLGAPTDFVEFLTQLAGVHDAKLRLDEVRCNVIVPWS